MATLSGTVATCRFMPSCLIGKHKGSLGQKTHCLGVYRVDYVRLLVSVRSKEEEDS